MHRIIAVCGFSASITITACSKKSDDANLAPAASALSVSTTDPTTNVWHYVVDPKSTTEVDMPGLSEHIKGGTTAATGTLDIGSSDLTQSRGVVRADLSTFTTRTFSEEEKNATQTKHARTWLEVVVDGKTNESMRWAEFAIRSIDTPSATDLRTVSPVKEGAEDVRAVTMTVRGDLLIHGHKLPKEDVVDVSFRYPAGAAPASKPLRIEIKSKQPMRVVLKEHDVTPRDPGGQLLAWTTSLVSKVAETADVTIALTATPLP
ncbi:MAG: hypothetical protein M3O46_21195 [Myxococcota bacterium]|nr:hypothetical protein [Myxococcota bacterium]